MACPSSGEISLLGIAREKKFDNYSSGSIPTGNSEAIDAIAISLKDVSTSGYSHSGNVEFEATNSDSSSKPDGSTPHEMSEFHSYDHDFVARVGFPVYTTSVPKPVFACSQSTSTTWYFPDTTPAVNDYVYTTASGSTNPNAGNYGYAAVSPTTNFRFTVSPSGQISAVASCSDRRLKKNIKLIGYSPSGLKIYTFEYVHKFLGDGVSVSYTHLTLPTTPYV